MENVGGGRFARFWLCCGAGLRSRRIFPLCCCVSCVSKFLSAILDEGRRLDREQNKTTENVPAAVAFSFNSSTCASKSRIFLCASPTALSTSRFSPQFGQLCAWLAICLLGSKGGGGSAVAAAAISLPGLTRAVVAIGGHLRTRIMAAAVAVWNSAVVSGVLVTEAKSWLTVFRVRWNPCI